MVLAGTESDRIGTCGGRIVITIGIMDAHAGSGVATDESECTCTAIGVCGVTIKVGGVVSAHTGISGNAIIITDQHDGSGVGTAVWVVTCIACVSSSDGLERSGLLSVDTGICTAVTITTTGSMGEHSGDGVVSVALECTATVCVRCTAIIRDIGVACARTGTCGDGIIITKQGDGSGAASAVLVAICTACAPSRDGLVHAGWWLDGTGICTVRTIITTDCMAALDGLGAVTGGLVCICTATERFGEITKVIGGGCAHTGTCGVATTTTNDRDGSGVSSEESTGTCIACVFSADGMAPAGTESALIGTCTGRTTTTIGTMADVNGVGDGSGALDFTDIGCEPSIAITRDTGAAFGRTGICGSVAIIIVSLAGLGEPTSVLVAICTASVFCTVGLVLAGSLSADIGNCTAATIIDTACMASTSGCGDNSAALDDICTVGESCVASGTTVGDTCAPIGPCGSATITTGHVVGSTVAPRGWVATCTACVCSSGGMVDAGLLSAVIGSCIVVMLTTIVSMGELGGRGDVSSALVVISTVAAFLAAIIKADGAMFGPTGICTSETTTTGRHVGVGADTDVSVDTSIACESSVVGTVSDGLLFGDIGICTVATTTQCSGRRRASLVGAAILSSILL